MRLRRQRPAGAVTPGSLSRPEWEYVPEGWARPVRGWDVPELEDVYRGRWPEFLAAVEGTAPLGVAHEVVEGVAIPREDPGWHNTVVTYGYVLARAAAEGTRPLSVLDWGGGCGHYYVLGRALLPAVELDYHCCDLPRLVALGRELLPEVTFHDADGAALARRYDLVLASGSLQYAEDLRGTLGRLAAAARAYLFVAQLPVAEHAPSFVVLQRPDEYGYATEYLGWVVARGELLSRAQAAGLRLERELVTAGEIDAPGAPERPVRYRSFLFRAGPDVSSS